MRLLKVLAAVTGVGALIVSAALVLGGVSILTVTNSDGFADLPSFRVAGPGAGIVAKNIDVYFEPDTNGVTFTPTGIRVRAEIDSSKEVFVGVGPTAVVTNYLDEAGYVQAEGRRGEIELALPDRTEFTDPSSAGIWLATNSGTSIDWPIADGDHAFVVLNRDGSNGLDVSVDGAIRIPFLRPAGGAMLGIGAVAGLAGLALLYVGIRREEPPPGPTIEPAATPA